MHKELTQEIKRARRVRERMGLALKAYNDAVARLPVIEADAEAAKQAASLDDEPSVEKLMKARLRLEVQKNFIERAPSGLDDESDKGLEALDGLNRVLVEIAETDRARVIAQAEKALQPFCGEAVHTAAGDSTLICRSLAEQAPVLLSIPRETDLPSLLYSQHLDSVAKISAVIERIGQAIEIAEKVAARGGFVTLAA